MCARDPSGCLLEDGRGVGKFLDVLGNPGNGGIGRAVLGVGGLVSLSMGDGGILLVGGW